MAARFLLLVGAMMAGSVDGVLTTRIGSVVLENVPAIPVDITVSLQPLENLRSASFADWLPGDLGMLIRTRFASVSQLHKVGLPDGARRQMTFFADAVAGGRVCPDPSRPVALFLKDEGGNEAYQVYALDYLTGECRLLTDGTSKYGSIVWSKGGRRFACSSNKRNGRDMDIYVGDADPDSALHLVLECQGYWEPMDWSPDDTRLLVRRYVSTHESYYYIVNLETGVKQEVNPAAHAVGYEQARWLPDGGAIALVSDEHGDFNHLVLYDLATGRQEILTRSIPWDVTEFELSPSGDTIAVVCNEAGVARLYLLDLSTRSISRVNLPDGWISNLGFHPSGDRLAFVFTGYRDPGDIYVLGLLRRSLTRWTTSEVGALDTASFVLPEFFSYPAYDSVEGVPRMIPAYLYRPKDAGRPAPVLIDLHGGPESQAIPGFQPLFQYYVRELGIAVVAPNVRGSSGYGKSYTLLDNGLGREGALRDVGALLDWIARDPRFDRSRIAVAGGSYGGFLALATMVEYGDRLCCGIDAYGISNFVTFLQNTAEYRRDLRRVEYGDERDPEMRAFLDRISPLRRSGRIKSPLLVIQGRNDPRVPEGEARQIVDAVRANANEVWYVLAEDEGHGFARKANRDLARQVEVMFLRRFLQAR